MPVKVVKFTRAADMLRALTEAVYPGSKVHSVDDQSKLQVRFCIETPERDPELWVIGLSSLRATLRELSASEREAFRSSEGRMRIAEHLESGVGLKAFFDPPSALERIMGSDL